MKEQLDGLKSSFVNTFNSLSEIMVEEFESIRDDIQGSVGNYCPLHRTVEHLTLLCSKYDKEIANLNKRQEILETQVSKITPKDVDKDIEILKSQIEGNRESYQNLCDQVGDIISNMNEEVSMLKTHQVTCSSNIENIKRNISDLNQSIKLSSRVLKV